MQNLIPHFIPTQFSRNITRGDFVTATMFVDVSGFTTLTESLMQHETDGAEIVAAALNRVLNSSVAEVYAHGGFIATFAGSTAGSHSRCSQWCLGLQNSSVRRRDVARAVRRVVRRY